MNEKKGFFNSAKNFGGKVMYILVITLALAGVGFLLYKRLTTKKSQDFNAIPSVNVTHIRKGTISKDVSVMGNILPTDTYYVVAKVGGDIKSINVKNGDYVKKGDPICEIDASKEIEAAFIQYDTARSSFERMQKLYQAGDISLQNFETVKAQYEAAKLAYDTKVEYSVPVAVDDGVVENTNMTINTSISQGTIICYITSEGAKEINFGVTERVLSGLKMNDPVKIEKSGKVYDGYISNISNLISSQTGLFNVKAVITSENSFASGIMAKVTFPYVTKKNVNILPNELIYYEASMPYVFVVGDDGVLSKKYIEVGIENENYSEVITDLSKSLKIVSTWNNDLAEGATVNVIKDEKVEDEIEVESTVKIIDKKKNEDTIKIASESDTENIIEKRMSTNEIETSEETETTEKTITKEEVKDAKEMDKVETYAKELDIKVEVKEATIPEENTITYNESTNVSPFADKDINSSSVKITEVQ